MPAERTLNKPLSGPEIIESIVSDIRKTLERDCFLAPHMAYPSYSCDGQLNIKFQGTAVKSSTAYVRASTGEPDPSLPIQEETVSVDVEPKPPNEVRRESGQAVPVLAKTATGKLEEKAVKYAPKGKPKTTTKGAMQAS